MKIFLVSDLHIEFNISLDVFKNLKKSLLKTNDYDIIVLAGDITANKFLLVQFFEFIDSLNKPTFFVTGNKEYYNSTFIETDEYIEKLVSKMKNIYFLNSISSGVKLKEFPDFIFIGNTYWTNFYLGNENKNQQLNMSLAKNKLNDYQNILAFTENNYLSNEKKFIEPELILKKHLIESNKIKSEIKKNKNKKYVIVTHFAPTTITSKTMFKNSELLPLYCNDENEFIFNNSNIVAWFHGHSHNRKIEFINNTSIAINALGYPDEEFENELNYYQIIEIY